MRYQDQSLLKSLLITMLLVSMAKPVFSHVGHGDEFQAEGGIQRVQVNTQTDSMLGIVVTPISSTTDGSSAVMIPVTALVDADGKPLVFVKYQNFYEPVPVITGASRGELIEVTQGLSVGEQLVTQGSLSLYAESRKTQTADATAPSPAPISSPPTDPVDVQANATGQVVSQSSETTPPSDGFPMGILAALGGVAVLLVGGMTIAGKRKKGGL
jgi:membrane fusion protein, cation efflux system